MSSDSTLSTFIASDGDNIVVQDWPLSEDLPLRGVVVLVHGLGEHAGRYGKLAQQLNAWGFAVRGYDQYGHGESGGVRGSLPDERRLVDDLADILDSTRARMHRGLPLIVLGHSMGGLVAARLVALRLRAVDGLILSSPALDTGIGAFRKRLISVAMELVPNFRTSNGVKPHLLSHDPDVVASYIADPLVHQYISIRLADFVVNTGAKVIARAAKWETRTLLLYAGDDRVLNPEGSRLFAAATPPGVVTSECFDGFYHEIFNESNSAPVYASLKRWLDQRF